MPNQGTDLIGGIAEILDLYVRSKEKERDLYKAQAPDLIEQEQPGGGTKLVEKSVGVDVKQPKTAKRQTVKAADGRWRYIDKDKELVFPNVKPEVEDELSESAKNLFKRRDDLRKLKDRLTLKTDQFTGKTSRIPVEESDFKQQKQLEKMDEVLKKKYPNQYFEFELAGEEEPPPKSAPPDSTVIGAEDTQDWINQFKRP
jgi:hypothetical protein